METAHHERKSAFPEYFFLLGLSIAFFNALFTIDYTGAISWFVVSLITALFLYKRYLQKYYTKENWKRHILRPLVIFGVVDGGILLSILLATVNTTLR